MAPLDIEIRIKGAWRIYAVGHLKGTGMGVGFVLTLLVAQAFGWRL